MKDDPVLRKFVSELEDGVYIVDHNRSIIFWNESADRLTGYKASEVTGKCCANNLLRHVTDDGHELCIDGCPLADTIIDGEIRSAEVYMHHKNGHRIPVAVHTAPLQNEKGDICGAIEIFTDHSDRSAVRAELEYLRNEVLSDPLTSLGNRRYLELIATPRLVSLKDGGRGFGLFMIDIDHFKHVNDTYGHLVGDRVLVMVSKTITSAVRPLDAAVRWGGEEFVVICPNVPLETLAGLAERLRHLVNKSWIELENGTTLSVSICVGAARAAPGDTLKTVMARADERLYECKRTGRNRTLAGQ